MNVAGSEATDALSGGATVAAVVLAIVFAMSAWAKLREPSQTVATFRGLGLPLPHLLARLVPLVEIAVAIAILALPRPAGAATVVLLIAFTAVLVPQLGRPDPVACGCFGSMASHPVSVVEIARNSLLATAAVLVSLGAGGSNWFSPRLPDLVTGSAVVLLGAIALQLLALRRDVGPIFGADLAGEISSPTHAPPIHSSTKEATLP